MICCGDTMKTVFLCGGVGKRMWPITRDKFLLKFMGKTLLEHHITLAKEAGIKDFVFICNPENCEEIREIAGKCKVESQFAIQERAVGMAGALVSAKEYLDDEILIVSPHDIVDGIAYTRMMEERNGSSYNSYMLGYTVENYFPGGYLEVNESDEIIGIVEKPGKGNEPSNMVNIVFHLHKKPPDLMKYIESIKSSGDDIYEMALDRMMSEGIKFRVVRYEGAWIPIKYPWHMLDAVGYFLDKSEARISPEAEISETARIYGKVIIESGARVMDNAVIRGPCYIGKNCIVGNNALVRANSHMCDDSVAGYCTEVKTSYLGENCYTHMNYVGDSIIMENCNLGAGSITANWRFDGKNVRIKVMGEEVDTGRDKLGVIMGNGCKTGINTSIMPGVRVGENSIVGPGVILSGDLRENSIIVQNTT